jgi:hypothetical protein
MRNVQTEPPPTVRQVYALARALCERGGEEFPSTREEPSELIERLRLELGMPNARLEDTPRSARPPRRRGSQKFAASVASRVVEELRT